jgi:hypothetical protein
VYTPPGTERYTTPAHLDLEEYLVGEAAREVPQLVTPAQAEVALGLSDLDGAQAEVAAGLLAARTAVSVLVAPAGSGKTHTMAAVARAWTQWTGGRAVGVTLSTNAARVMAAEGMTQAVNVARFLGRLEDGGSRDRRGGARREGGAWTAHGWSFRFETLGLLWVTAWVPALACAEIRGRTGGAVFTGEG